MIATTNCLTEEDLRRYSLGDYGDDEGETIEAHLADCSTCERALAKFDDTGDSLVRHIPLAGQSDRSAEPANWMQRLMSDPQAEALPMDEFHDCDEGADATNDFSAYELFGVLGEGGMGVVYAARHRRLGKPVAIKVVRPQLVATKDSQRRFDREIQVLGGLNHPGIVSATDAGKFRGAAYLVMERVDGANLSSLVRHTGALQIREACEIVRQMAIALAAAHDAAAVHRDIKPSNVMIDRTGQVKLLDFGLAHLSNSLTTQSETTLGRLLGTLDYMAPEQAAGDSVGPSADLYGLGATLFFLLAGYPPRATHEKQNLIGQLKRIAESPAPPLSDLRSDVPESLGELTAELLSIQPTDRPEDARYVAERLRQWCDDDASERLKTLLAEVPPDEFASPDDDVEQSLAALLGSPKSKVSVGQTQPVAAGAAGRGYGPIIGLLGAAAFCFAIWMEIVILLETDKGTVRIESEVDDVIVELLDEEDHATRLTIENSEGQMRLKAGKYQVRIAGEHDSLVVQPSVIVLKSHDTQTAKITLANTDNDTVATSGDSGSSDGLTKDKIVWSDDGTVSLTYAFASELDVTTETLRSIDEVLQQTWKKYIALERKHSNYSLTPEGHLEVHLFSPGREQHQLDDEFWAQIDQIIPSDKRDKIREIRTFGRKPEGRDVDVLPSLIGWSPSLYPISIEIWKRGSYFHTKAMTNAYGYLGGRGKPSLSSRLQNYWDYGTQATRNHKPIRSDNVASVVDEAVMIATPEGLEVTGTESAGAPDRLLYEGQPATIWQHRFDAETNPAAKIDAAKALIALSEPMSDAVRIERILSLGGQIVRGGWGDDPNDYFPSYKGRSHARLKPTRWSLASYPGLETALSAFNNQATSIADTLSPESVAKAISRSVKQESGSGAMFATDMLYQLHNSEFAAHDATVDMVLNLRLDDDSALQIHLCTIQFEYFEQGSGAAKQKFAKYASEVGDLLATSSFASDHYAAASEWLEARGRNSVPVSRDVLGRVLMQLLFADPDEVIDEIFQAKWMSTGEFAYPDGWMKPARERGQTLWNAWLPIANAYLTDHPEISRETNSILQTLDIVLRGRKSDDEWPIKRLVELLNKRLERRMTMPASEASKDAKSPHDLLAWIVLAGGDIPTSLLQQEVPGDDSRLQSFQRMCALYSNEDFKTRNRMAESLKGITSEKPIAIVRLAFGYDTDSDRYVPLDMIGPVSTRGNGDDSPPPMEPLLVLATLASMSGQSEQVDDRIAKVLESNGRYFGRHIDDALDYPYAIREIAKGLLLKIRQTATSERLTETIDKLLPTAQQSSNAPPPAVAPNTRIGSSSRSKTTTSSFLPPSRCSHPSICNSITRSPQHSDCCSRANRNTADFS